MKKSRLTRRERKAEKQRARDAARPLDETIRTAWNYHAYNELLEAQLRGAVAGRMMVMGWHEYHGRRPIHTRDTTAAEPLE